MKQKILLADSAGAFLSAILLVVVAQWPQVFGITRHIAYGLLPIPLVFSLYSLLSYRFGIRQWRIWLRIIAVANLLYCILTGYVIIEQWYTLTRWGVAYFLGEIGIILLLVMIEWRIAGQKEN